MRKTLVLSLILLLAAAPLLTGCATNKGKGAAYGSAGGAAIGAAIGNQTGNTLLGAIIGATVGGAAGAYIGSYMDRQAAEMERDLEGASIERVGEGIKITFDSGILFDIDRAELQAAARENLRQLAQILQKYPDTNILIEGHTDNTGSEEHNLVLSRARAQAVANFLAELGVDATRFTIMGYGESQPVADNATVEGRRLNRRVEIAVMANDDLKKVAERRAE